MIRRRLLDALNSPLPITVVEATPGAGKRALLRAWADPARRSPHESSERRVVLDAPHSRVGGEGVLREAWPVLDDAAEGRLGEFPTDPAQAPTQIAERLASARMPTAIGVLNAERLTADEVADLLQVAKAGAVRFVLAGIDLSEIAAQARESGIAVARIADVELELTASEVHAVLRSYGLNPNERAVQVVLRCTGGHAGLIEAAAAEAPQECESGGLTTERALGLFLARQRFSEWPNYVRRLLASLMGLPRFSSREAVLITGARDVDRLVHRLQVMGLGSMTWHPGIGQRVFRWRPSVLAVLRQVLGEDLPEQDAWRGRVVAAAAECGDRELHVATLVAAGDLAAAEAQLREWLWDVLPNQADLLWEPVEAIAPAALVDYPSLLCIRLRLMAASVRSPVSAGLSIAMRVARGAANAPVPSDVWRRLHELARSFEFSWHTEDRSLLRSQASRARSLLEDLVAPDARRATTRGAISDLLLIAEILLRTGNATAAAEIAQRALDLLERDPRSLDPQRERAEFAGRLVLLSRRERGLEDLLDADALLTGAPFVWRDADLVARALAMAWGDLDQNDLAAASVRVQLVSKQIVDGDRWPKVQYLRAWLSVLNQDASELNAVLDVYLAGQPRPSGTVMLPETSMQIPDTFLSQVSGRPVPHPEFLPLPPTPSGSPFSPRVVHTHWLEEALLAIRSGRDAAARLNLERAITLLPSHPLCTLVLARATREEIARLAALIADHPLARLLNLDAALPFAETVRNPTSEFSDREREVLLLMRGGATNAEMAKAMYVSVNTVKFHRANLMRKLGATSREEVLEAAAILGF